jgi:hypothetical protein
MMRQQPTDGYGLYEALSPWNASTYTARLAHMAAGGFKLVMNYNLLYTTADNLAAYINATAACGMRVIVALNEQPLWDGTTDLTLRYPDLCASTGVYDGPGLVQYVVNLVKGLPGTWGYYVGDEVAESHHAQLKTHADLIKATDGAHPRLYIDGVSGAVSHAMGNSPFTDVAEVAGSDHYPIGYYAGYTLENAAQYAVTIQAEAAAHGFSPTYVCQCMDWTRYYPPARCSPYPACARFPTRAEMRRQRDLVLAHMTARLLLWYSYFDLVATSDPERHWADLIWAANGISS